MSCQSRLCPPSSGKGVLTRCTISNPLADVEQFAHEGLKDQLDLLKEGALVAQDPASFDSLEQLDEHEKEFLRYEAAIGGATRSNCTLS